MDYSDFSPDPDFSENVLTPPRGAVLDSDPAEALRGRNHSQVHLAVAAAGIDLDRPALDIIATPVLSDDLESLGVWYVTGNDTRHHSMIVEQDAGVVLLGAPVRPERGDALVGWVEENIGKPITHIVVSHHHYDHAGGVRSVAAAGATTVVSQVSQTLFEQALDAPSTVVADTLSRSPLGKAAEVIGVPTDDFVEIPDLTNPISIYYIPTPHADDMLMSVVTNEATGTSVAFVVDLWNPAPFNFSFPPWAIPAFGAFASYGIETGNLLMAGGHGGVGTFAEFEDFVNSLE